MILAVSLEIYGYYIFSVHIMQLSLEHLQYTGFEFTVHSLPVTTTLNQVLKTFHH